MIDLKLTLSLIGTILTIVIVAPLISPLWKQVVFVGFAIYTLPLINLRNEFRSLVYDTDDWKINIKPVFIKELKALLSDKGFNDEQQIIAKRYRIY
jgi:peroxiredoxin Q/BCP